MVCPGPICFASVTAAATLIPAGAAEQQAFFAHQPVDEVHGLRVRDAQRIVDGSTLEIRGDAARADALGDRRAAVGFQYAVLDVVVQRAAGGIDENDSNRSWTST